MNGDASILCAMYESHEGRIERRLAFEDLGPRLRLMNLMKGELKVSDLMVLLSELLESHEGRIERELDARGSSVFWRRRGIS